jgi:hypothetical protein
MGEQGLKREGPKRDLKRLNSERTKNLLTNGGNNQEATDQKTHGSKKGLQR